MTLEVRELTCRELAGCLGDYFGGSLGPQDRALFEAHLAECPDCRTYLRSYGETVRLVKDAYRDDPVPADVPERLVRVILAARRRR